MQRIKINVLSGINESANVTSTGGTRPKLNCTYCGKDNHTVDKCFKKEKDDKKAEKENAAVSMVMTEATASSAVVEQSRITCKSQ